MLSYIFKEENRLTSEDSVDLADLLVPLFSWSYHFSHSYKKNHTLYFDSKPTWRLLLYDDHELMGSLSIVRREIIKPFPMFISGIGNLGIKESHQKKGLSTSMLIKSHDFLKDKGIDISLLFCIERLKDIYIKAGYLQMEKPVTYYSEGKLQEEPLALFYPILLDSEKSNFIQHNGLNIGNGSW